MAFQEIYHVVSIRQVDCDAWTYELESERERHLSDDRPLPHLPPAKKPPKNGDGGGQDRKVELAAGEVEHVAAGRSYEAVAEARGQYDALAGRVPLRRDGESHD